LAHPPRPVDLLLDGLTRLAIDGPATAAPALRQAASALASSDATMTEGLRWGWMAYGAASTLWDDDRWRTILLRQVQLARHVGALDHLPILLGALTMAAACRGDFAAATALNMEADAAAEVTGSRIAPYAAMLLAAFQGIPAEAAPMIDAIRAEAPAGGQGAAVTYAQWAAAILANGLGRCAEALAAARQAREDRHLYISTRVLPELIEAAARTGNADRAGDALDRLTEVTRAGGTDDGLGVQARCRALLSGGKAAEGLYREAIERLGRTQLRPDLARARLLYGEWLRRENRRADARAQLRAAHDLMAEIGMEAFAERARRELLATGDTVRKRKAKAPSELTAQEAHIARLVVEGHTNPEIGAQLFLSSRTVEWHLRKVFTKLDISSRRELRQPPAGRGRANRRA
jgi:DNA-binding CsgD family transcriptional regulator